MGSAPLAFASGVEREEIRIGPLHGHGLRGGGPPEPKPGLPVI